MLHAWADVGWTRVSHVCSRWRHVALGFPSLWSDIPLHYPDWAQAMLMRSKMASLNVIFGCGPYNPPSASAAKAAAVKAAVLKLSHIKNLELSPGRIPIADYLEIIKLLDAPAPFLQTANLAVEPTLNVSLPRNLFAGASPYLTVLILSGWGFDVRLPIVANLRTLKLCNVPTDGKIPVDQFISALSTMTRLETLHVIDSLGRPQGVIVNSPPPAQQAQLPQLTELSIDATLSTCIFLLDRIVSPSSTRLSAKYTNDLAGVDSDISVVRSLAEKLRPRVSGPIRSMKLLPDRIKVWGSLHAPSDLDSEDPPPDLEISLPDLQSEFEPSVRCFIHLLTLTHLETVYLGGDFTMWLFETYFGNLSHLTTVVAGQTAYDIISALAIGLPRMGSAAGAQRANLKFLALKSLTLEQWDFEHMPMEDGTAGVTAVVLLACLKGRKKIGAPLPKLIIDYCRHVDEARYVDPLRAVVGEVEWDEETNYTTESYSGSEDEED
ncbi:hypothetical protein DXG03_001267 [Asterophora parasitica]|uniref:F-box domain-containing protein n=1 Tax=Asterophora parasitica TaxID=117018 RepID=A0A9P7GA29_9AGAR|nr:hypothetical protein DXG03_001267 [Asterophora parasitica]